MATQYKPILFSTEMVQANLEGRKKQTRRLHGLDEINKNPNDWTFHSFSSDENRTFAFFRKQEGVKIKSIFGISPYQIGDILWVRETFFDCSSFKEYPLFSEIKGNFCYKTNDFIGCHKWKPSIYMPKKAARIFLEVTNVRVERLQDISEEDVIAEGVKMIKKGEKYEDLENGELISKKHKENYYYFYPGHDDFRDDSYMPRSVFPNAHISSFFSLWCLIHNEKSWKSNPWVWVYEFKVVEKPKDFTHEH